MPTVEMERDGLSSIEEETEFSLRVPVVNLTFIFHMPMAKSASKKMPREEKNGELSTTERDGTFKPAVVSMTTTSVMLIIKTFILSQPSTPTEETLP